MADEIVLNVRFIVDLSTFAIRTTTDSTVAEFKLLVALHFDVPVDRQRLFHDNRELRNDRTIESYGLQEGNVVYLISRSVPATASASTSVAAAATPLDGNGTPDISSKVGSVQNQGYGCGISASSPSGLDGSSDGTVSGVLINVQYSSETRFTVRVRPESTVGEFKDLISQLQNIPVNEQGLIYCGQFLQDEKTIGSYGLQEGNVVYLIRRSVPATASASTSVAAAATPLVGNGTPDISSKVGCVQNQGYGCGISASSASGLDGSSDGTVSGVLINVQYSSETRFAIRVRPESTVGEFKDLISQLQNIPVIEQRLIYSGQFLQDEKTIGSYGVREGHVIHLARRLVPATSCTSASVASPPIGGNSTDAFLIGAGFDRSQGFEGELFGYGLPGFEQLQQHMSGNPNTISEMMNIPAQNLMDEPHIVRIILMNNMWIRESIDRNPEFVYVLSNPGALRRRLEAVRSLEQIGEMVQNRITRNIESLPEGSEGSSMLRQRYENVPEPLLNAPHNPWGTNAATRGFLANNTLRNRAAGAYVPGFAGLGIPGPSGFAGAYVPGFAGLGIPGPSGLNAQSSSFIDPAMRIQALQHPATFQIIDEVIHNDPQPSSLVDFNRQVLEALQNPEMSTSQLASSGILQVIHNDLQPSSLVDFNRQVLEALQNPEMSTGQLASSGMLQVIHNDPQSSSLVDFNPQVLEAVQNPEMTVSQLASRGRLQVIHNDPQSSSLVDFNPQVLEAVQNPEMTVSQLASRGRLQQLRASRAFPLGISISRGTGQTARGAAGMFDGQTAGRAVPFEETRVNQQLSLLHEMGFTDNYASLRALIATSGDIGAAVALLLQNLGR